MAIGAALSPHDVDSFVHADRTWYSSKIPNSHNQLRHMSSSPQANCIYFANQKDVYKIDTASKKRRHVTELPFEPKCTATGHGFFCAGDDKGYFAYLRIPEGATPLTHASESPLADLATASQRPGFSSLLDDSAFLGQMLPSRTMIQQVGGDIMNSISIHRIRSPEEGVDDDIVAVITCNDRIVRTWSLIRNQEQVVDEFPKPMNHATLSPDEQRLVIVGDHDCIYFYRRRDIREHLQCMKDLRNRELTWYKWEQEQVFQLPGGPGFDYFTTAWSDTGRLCATASEGGYIIVFAVDAIAEAEDVTDCVVTFAPSSRPQTAAGAVRTMCFAPDPWDYLIWAENNGRVCVGDLRSQLVFRQAIKLDPKAEGVNKVQLTDSVSSQPSGTDHPDIDAEMEFIRQRRDELGRDIDSVTSLYQPLHLRSGESSLRDSGLDEDERQILDNLRTSRERTESHQAALRNLQGTPSRPSPRSISYLPGARNVDRSDGSPRPTAGSHTPVPAGSGTGSGSELARLRQDAAVLDTLRNFMRDRSGSHRDTTNTGSSTAQQPRRRNSVILSPPSGAQSNTRPPDEPQSDPWQIIEAAMTRVREGTQNTTTYASIARDAREAIANRARGDDSREPYLSLPPMLREMDSSDAPSLDTPSVNIPIPESTRGPTTGTGVTLPSLRDPSFRGSMAELSAALPRTRDVQPSTSNDAATGPSRNMLSLRDAEGLRSHVERQRDILRRREQEREQERERSQERQRERERSWRRDALQSRQYENSLLRRVGVAPPLRILNAQEEALHQRVYALPANEAEREEWGIGTAGVMIPPLPQGDDEETMVARGARTLYVGTEEGVMELKLDFGTRKLVKGWEWK